jgi:hypothetical protein
MAAKEAKKIKISVDVVTHAVHHLQFLKHVAEEPALLDPDVLQVALHRYEKYWLPLIAESHQEHLPAPLDVEWMWHCHVLSPLAYHRDCMNLFGHVIDHQLFSDKDRAKKLQKSRSLWQDKYPRVPFEVDFRSPPALDPGWEPSRLSYNVLGATTRQKEFQYQTSLPHFRDKQFLNFALTRYKKFLYLKQQIPSLFIVPCYDNDLLWHTHQLFPLAYKSDTEAILGRTLNHDDTSNDRSPNSKLDVSQKETQEKWLATYNENFHLFGAMYRGETPTGKLFRMTSQHCYDLATKSCMVRFERLELKRMPQLNGKLKLKLSTAANAKVKSTIATFQGPGQWQDKNLAEVNFDTREVNCIKFSVLEQRGWACFGSKMVIAENELNLLPIINAVTQPCPLEKVLPLNQVRISCKPFFFVFRLFL